jgi:dipeptidyl aminopeptidase/acylaminoacyl peptidase
MTAATNPRSTPVPYGAWPSPISARSLVEGAVGISEVRVDPQDPDLVWWSESRPDEGGRTAIMQARLARTGTDPVPAVEVTPPGANVRTLVHEYGGGSWWPDGGALHYVDFSDQRLRRLDPGGEITELTPEPPAPRAFRYADGRLTPDGDWIVCVRERHDTDGEPANELVAIATDGSMVVEVLWAGADFVMAPRLALDGKRIAWISWDHPNMPWDSTRLHIHGFANGRIGDEIVTLGTDDDISFCEPEYGIHGLRVCSDHEGWWNLYDVDHPCGTLLPAVSGSFDIATPPWVFGMQRWGAPASTPFGPEHLFAVAGLPTGDELIVDGRTIATADSSISSVSHARPGAGGDLHGGPGIAYAGAGYDHETEVVWVGISEEGGLRRTVVRPSRELAFDRGFLISPESISFPTGPDGDATAHALFYPPTNPDHVGPSDAAPPLLVLAHGGPTAQARRQLQTGILYWTSRGIAVVDVDYRGSTGYGRAYRRVLEGQWGIADVEDCVAAARYLAARGDVDGGRLMIRGGSAGGFTVLAALAFHDVFAVGASRYGVADLEALATDTHKFESRYLDSLIGPYPEAKELYVGRSPIHHVDRLDVPMIVLQGDEDAIVPPNQSEMIVEALEAKGVPVSYVVFEGEQHGFRQADNIVAALESELAFFGRVLGFSPADALPELEIR